MPRRNRYSKRSRLPVGNFNRCVDPSLQPSPPPLRVQSFQVDVGGEEMFVAFDQGVIGPNTLRIYYADGMLSDANLTTTALGAVLPQQENRTFRVEPFMAEFVPGNNIIIMRQGNEELRSNLGEQLGGQMITITEL